MNCNRSLELISDLVENELPPILEREMRSHLSGCGECRALTAAVREVVAALRLDLEVEPPESLTENVLLHTSTSLRDLSGEPNYWLPPVASWIAAAAIFAAVALWRPPDAFFELSREVSQTAHKFYSFGVRTYHETDRWIEELNVLRITMGVAFEDRIDRLSEKLRDLEEARRKTSSEGESSSATHESLVHSASNDLDRRSLV
ncbi:MAG TPA: zf-HC2 domain-containing protein [Vicinamibacteria bacterium]|nr:zf-HC2 domain-containing protein [Vicinamibacteria bacterium]